MKKVFALLLLVAVLFSYACQKGNHSVRFKNDYNQTIYNIAVGNISFGYVDPGHASDYKQIIAGSFVISGTAASGQGLSSTGSISGKGTDKWTIALDKNGKINITKD